MKETILKKASELFLKLGFKSVTMDDIANELAISKKTIYKFFDTKNKLVQNTVIYIHETMHQAVSGICNVGHNAIQENFEIKKLYKDLLKNSDDSPMYQLQKYYPSTFNDIISKEYHLFKDCIIQNLEKGIKEGLYRKNIDKELTTKFYFSLVLSVYDTALYTYSKNTMNTLEIKVLEYHTRAIATEKGIKVLEEQLHKNN